MVSVHVHICTISLLRYVLVWICSNEIMYMKFVIIVSWFEAWRYANIYLTKCDLYWKMVPILVLLGGGVPPGT